MTEKPNDESFRDRVANVTEQGTRKWIYPKRVKGKFYKIRSVWSWFQFLIFIGLPFITLNGHEFFVLDFFERKFILFGLAFGPHDFHIFGLLMIAAIIFIFLFTAVYGRIFCGWLCPQTLFMEMIFRKIEYLIEGDAGSQKRLDRSEMDGKKFLTKTSKHLIFFLLSLFITHILLAYFMGGGDMLEMASQPFENTRAYVLIIVFSLLLYFEYTRFREQLCTFICPYGRLQGVLINPDSIVIAYDDKRGELRQHFSGIGVTRNYGDCIDCHQCVAVCPTGIDIRNGTQLECINCTNCIDACNRVMDIVKLQPGLIRYASRTEILTGVRKIFTPRVIGYTTILTVLVLVISLLLVNRTDFELTILRTPGLMWQERPDNKVSNIYDLKVVNKTFEDSAVELKLISPQGDIQILGDLLDLKSQILAESKFLVILDRKNITRLSTPIEIEVLQNNKTIDRIKTTFLAKPEERGKNEN